MPARRPSSTPGASRRGAGARPTTGRDRTRRTTRVAPTPTEATPTTSSRARLTGRAAILLLVVAVLSVSYASSLRAWIHQQGEINALDAQIAEQQDTIAALSSERRRWKDPAFIEIQAKLRFGWLMPGETGYRVIDEDGEVLSAGPAQLTEPTDDRADGAEWWENAWGSVEEAAETPEQIAAEIAARQPDREPAERIVPEAGDAGDR